IDESDEKLKRLNSSKGERLAFLNLLHYNHFQIESLCLSAHRRFPLGSSDSNYRHKSLDIMYKAIDFASDLGIRIIQLAGYDVYYEASNNITQKNFENNLYHAVNYAAEKGVVLGFETMETPFMDTVAKAMHYVNKLNSPYLKVSPDIGNLTNAALLYGDNILDDIEKGRGNLVSAHLKETVPGKYREISFGEGHVNFEKSIQKLYRMGVRKYVAEFWDLNNDNWFEELKYNYQFIKNKFDAFLS